MTRKAALVATTLLTVFVLVIMLGVLTRLTAADANAVLTSDTVAQDAPQSAQVSPVAQSGTAPVVDAQLAQQREQIYRQRLDEANTQIQQANAQIQEANEQLQQLRAQNTQLLQREQTYQQRLQEANNRLMQPGGQELAALQTVQSASQSTASQQATPSAQTAALPVAPQPQQSLSQQMLTQEQAAAIAAQYMDGVVRGVRMVNAGGTTAYDVTFGSGGDVGVDAYNGNVLFIREGQSVARNPGTPGSRKKGHEHDNDD